VGVYDVQIRKIQCTRRSIRACLFLNLEETDFNLHSGYNQILRHKNEVLVCYHRNGPSIYCAINETRDPEIRSKIMHLSD
jgi:hypothetical protein